MWKRDWSSDMCSSDLAHIRRTRHGDRGGKRSYSLRVRPAWREGNQYRVLRGKRALGVAHNAATRCLDGTQLDRHEYILRSPDALQIGRASCRERCGNVTGVQTCALPISPTYAGRGMATEAANAAIRYAFGQLGAKAISIGYFEGNEP